MTAHKGASCFNIAAIALGLAFLYLPIAILVMYSFNDSRSVAVWGGWSLRWYRELLHDSAMLEAAWTSLRIALLSATAATILGTFAAVVLTRIGRFRGRLPFSAMIYAPLVLPEVIIGLALLLLFVAVDFDRGFWTTALAHATLTMCFVAAIVQARLIDFDRSIEEAAMDLGCSPLRTFLTVTLPLILPAIASGWMLAFTLSLDDFVIASFTTGPGATTLPIRIYSEVRLGVKPETNAICTLMIASVALMVVTASLLSKRYAVSDEKGAALAAPV
jgi:putrescine transport system permease protein